MVYANIKSNSSFQSKCGSLNLSESKQMKVILSEQSLQLHKQ